MCPKTFRKQGEALCRTCIWKPEKFLIDTQEIGIVVLAHIAWAAILLYLCVSRFSQDLQIKRHSGIAVPRLNRNLKFIILIISNAITEILCIDTVKFPVVSIFQEAK